LGSQKPATSAAAVTVGRQKTAIIFAKLGIKRKRPGGWLTDPWRTRPELVCHLLVVVFCQYGDEVDRTGRWE
jgi:hypothetical protein